MNLVSVWGLRRSSTNLCQDLIDEFTDASVIEHGDAWKHGYPRRAHPDAVHWVVTKHPLAWIQSEEAWRHGGLGQWARRLRNLVADAIAHRDPFRAVVIKWGLALDKWAALHEAWSEVLDPVIVTRYEDLLRDPHQALAQLEDHGIQVDDDVELPGGRIMPSATGPQETNEGFDASRYLEFEWAQAYSENDLVGIERYIRRHGQDPTWGALGYGTARPWIEDRPPGSLDPIEPPGDDSVHFYRRAPLLQGGPR